MIIGLNVPQKVATVGRSATAERKTLLNGMHEPDHYYSIPEVGYQDRSIATTTLLQYLSRPSPEFSLVRQDRIHELGPARESYFWFDVRNISTWSAFNTNTLMNTTQLKTILHREQLCNGLALATTNVDLPVTPNHLRQLHYSHYGIRLNSALKASMAESSLQISNVPADGSSMQPDFVSKPPGSHQQSTSQSSKRGRVIGIVLCYEQWRSDMRRSENPTEKVRYLSGLARLQYFLREHGCRYGYIITEIELVCVRYGGDDKIYEISRSRSSTTFAATVSSFPIPIFGYFEVSNAVPLSRHTQDAENVKMTASLALWYLHMQAYDQPLPGHHHWRLEVGGPSTMTRKKHLFRDSEWMPKMVHQREQREANRKRGWVWPNEESSKGKGKGRRTVLGKS
ncbi:hypothetical protein E4T38_03983 [Aureobasidium subglaciale]|nr:hypothetical protein E4T38_03983 [Aureobasidium subglaciale]KAI5224837.1 hypothetical protein E4T40_03758 [Aureobasidium subglaciale]KAI5227952.1 hypothetical protein E4T41_03978 [Aureobasidium subglaciale]KAI5263503.1 hypothetical protein E4T46_03599 [Aureobasidium subglaciale]